MEQLYELYLSSKGVCIDTRKIRPGELYIAIKGDNFDGNKFALDALSKGALACIVSDSTIDNERCHFVNDTLKMLQQLANHHRRQFSIPVIGITGSNGKTTTKELIHAVLASEKTVNATKGNLNNHLGVPLTILSWAANTQIAIVEMGANHIGEIAELCQIAEPNLGLITNIGKAHLEGFGSLEGVKKAKSELYAWLFNTNGKVFYNADDEFLVDLVRSFNISNARSFGTSIGVNTLAEMNDETPLALKYKNANIQTQLVGNYNFSNALTAIAIGEEFGISATNIKLALQGYSPTNNRSQVVEIGTNKFILDAYNANPSSMKLAIENILLTAPTSNAFVLGDMLELGIYSTAEHQAVLEVLKKNGVNKALLVGPEFYKLRNASFDFVLTNIEAKEWLKTKSFEHHTILIKGSRGIALEKVIDSE